MTGGHGHEAERGRSTPTARSATRRGPRSRSAPPTGRADRDRRSRFVVQQHAARRLHWDLRLEIDGVLVSWAVPRGPSVDPKEKRLAVQTEDHPLEYADFEGLIPAGNYGAGAMIVWDRGTYRSLDGVAPADGLRAGKLDLELRGHKLRGRWALVRTKGERRQGVAAVQEARRAVAGPRAGRRAARLGALRPHRRRAARRRAARRRARRAGRGGRRAAPRACRPSALAPMLAETAERAVLATRLALRAEVRRRARADRPPGAAARRACSRAAGATPPPPSRRSPRAAAHLPADDFVIDGELIALDERGTGSFERLQQRLGLTNPWAVARAAAAVPVQVYAFDLLAVAGHDLRALPLPTRKAMLRRLVPAQGVIRYADHIEERGRGVLRRGRASTTSRASSPSAPTPPTAAAGARATG